MTEKELKARKQLEIEKMLMKREDQFGPYIR